MKYFSSGSDIRQNSNRLQFGKTVENVTGRDFATFLFHIFLVTPFAGTLWNIMCVCGGGRKEIYRKQHEVIYEVSIYCRYKYTVYRCIYIYCICIPELSLDGNLSIYLVPTCAR